ncbi:hypothetical protein GDO86_017699 [Hymenochirus boettgeri]|uniref:Uncharacterized protein n=1 Tax=Hymenochirus boettgeri TaxID=247094 RepID=A0A8T2IKY0_9PIPI|nr:hypothetical protein GDO86_017699 [Hymenochirus boettgeri]
MWGCSRRPLSATCAQNDQRSRPVLPRAAPSVLPLARAVGCRCFSCSSSRRDGSCSRPSRASSAHAHIPFGACSPPSPCGSCSRRPCGFVLAPPRGARAQPRPVRPSAPRRPQVLLVLAPSRAALALRRTRAARKRSRPVASRVAPVGRAPSCSAVPCFRVSRLPFGSFYGLPCRSLLAHVPRADTCSRRPPCFRAAPIPCPPRGSAVAVRHSGSRRPVAQRRCSPPVAQCLLVLRAVTVGSSRASRCFSCSRRPSVRLVLAPSRAGRDLAGAVPNRAALLAPSAVLLVLATVPLAPSPCGPDASRLPVSAPLLSSVAVGLVSLPPRGARARAAPAVRLVLAPSVLTRARAVACGSCARPYRAALTLAVAPPRLPVPPCPRAVSCFLFSRRPQCGCARAVPGSSVLPRPAALWLAPVPVASRLQPSPSGSCSRRAVAPRARRPPGLPCSRLACRRPASRRRPSCSMLTVLPGRSCYEVPVMISCIDESPWGQCSETYSAARALRQSRER